MFSRYETIVSWMEELAKDNPDFITLTDMGKSHEGRKILMLKVGTSPRGSETRAVWVDGGIHARNGGGTLCFRWSDLKYYFSRKK